MNASFLRLTVLRAHCRAVVFLLGTLLAAIWILLSPFAADYRYMDALCGIQAIAFIPPCLERLALQPSRPAAVLWTLIAVAMAVLALHAFSRFAAPRSGAATTDLMLTLAFLQVVALQIAFGLMLLFLLARRSARLAHGRDRSSLGDLGRFLYVYAGYHDRLRYPDFKHRTHLPFARQIVFVVHFLRWLPDLAPRVQRLTGRSAVRQAIDIFTLYFRHDLDAQGYYLFEFYRPEYRAKAAGYLTRFETKNGLINSLNRLFPRRRHNDRSELGDKIGFAELCSELGIRCIPVLAQIEEGEVRWKEGVDRNLPHDFFVKRRVGKGAFGAGLYRHLPGGGHQAPSGSAMPTEALLTDLAARSKQARQPNRADEGPVLPEEDRATKKHALLIQPRLRNHPELADLVEESLIVIRVITCQDKEGTVTVTHAMLRILGMLEPNWQTKVEFASPIDLESGCLGPMTGDKGEMATCRFDRHPIRSDVQVVGRMVPQFQAILAEAVAAHRSCGDRFIIGWDIAVTPDGPVIVEGNAHLDIEFPQRVHQMAISESRMGPILHSHLMLLDRSVRLFDLVRKL